MLTRLLVLTAVALALPASASAATISRSGAVVTYSADPGHNDVIRVTAGAALELTSDVAAGNAPLTGIAPCAGTPTKVTCPLAGVTGIVARLGDRDDSFLADVSIPVDLDGGPGHDTLTGGAAADRLVGGSGSDSIFGAGADDQIEAKDGERDHLDGGSGLNDSASSDTFDIRVGVEAGPADNELVPDRDDDGVTPPLDCDDRNLFIRPGAPDAPGNGIDEDCDGADDIDLDRDRDGFGRPEDCNDANAAISPRAAELEGNRVDENCDGRIEDFRVMDVLVANSWSYRGSSTRVNQLIVRGGPKGARIDVRCSGRGCRFKRKRTSVARDNRGVDITRFFRRARLRTGTRIRIGLSHRGHIGNELTFTTRREDVPLLRRVCVTPGEPGKEPC